MQKAQISWHHINYNLQYDLSTSFDSKNENMPCNDAYNRKIINLQTSILPFTEKYKKDTSNRHKATSHIKFIQSIYKYNRRASKSHNVQTL